VSALLVPGWSQADCPYYSWAHVIAVFFMNLFIASKLKSDMFVVIKVLAREEVA
jgi:hypothetical protein